MSNEQALLGLLAELYSDRATALAQVHQLQQQNAALRAEIETLSARKKRAQKPKKATGGPRLPKEAGPEGEA